MKDVVVAINMADYDNIKELSCSIDDLLLLRKHILEQEIRIKELSKQNAILDSKISLKILEKPVKLSVYA